MDTSKWQDGFRKLRRAPASSGLHLRGADPRPAGAPASGRPDAPYARVSRLASVDIVYVPMPMTTSSAFCSV